MDHGLFGQADHVAQVTGVVAGITAGMVGLRLLKEDGSFIGETGPVVDFVNAVFVRTGNLQPPVEGRAATVGLDIAREIRDKQKQ